MLTSRGRPFPLAVIPGPRPSLSVIPGPRSGTRNPEPAARPNARGTLPLMLPLTWSGARLGQRLQRGNWRIASAVLVLSAGLLTLAAPWLLQVPALHGVLSAIGCLPRPV